MHKHRDLHKNQSFNNLYSTEIFYALERKTMTYMCHTDSIAQKHQKCSSDDNNNSE